MTARRSVKSWRSYLDEFHERRFGITEDVLTAAESNATGTNPYDWLLEVLPKAGTVLDVACGSGPLLAIGSSRRRVGIDRSAAELTKAALRPGSFLVRGDASALPFADDTFDAATCSMGLMLFDPVDAALDEIRRVVRFGGTVVFLLPGSFPLRARDRLRYIRLLAALRKLTPAYPNRIHLGGLRRHLGKAGFTVGADDRQRFRYPLLDEHATQRFVESLYAPGDPPARVASSIRWITARDANVN